MRLTVIAFSVEGKLPTDPGIDPMNPSNDPSSRRVNILYFPISHSASVRIGLAIYLNETQSILCAESTKNGNKFRVTPWAWAHIDGQGD